MYKKSPSNSGGSKRNSGGSFKKNEGRSDSFSKRPYKKADDSTSGRPRKPYGSAESGDSRSSFKRDSSSGDSFGKKPYKKTEGSKRPYKSGESAGERGGFKRDRGADDSFNKRPYKTDDRRDAGAGRSFRANDSGDSRGGFKRDKGADDSFNKRPYKKDESRGGDFEKKPYKKFDGPRAGGDKTDRPYKSFRAEGGKESSFKKKEGFSKPLRSRDSNSAEQHARKTSFDPSESGSPTEFGARRRDSATEENKPYKRPYKERSASEDGDRKPVRRESASGGPKKRPYSGRAEAPAKRDGDRKETPADFYKKKERPYTTAEDRYLEDDNEQWEVVEEKKKKGRPAEAAQYPMPLNKFIAHSGECSRRDAAELVRQGKAKVNGELIVDPGHKINEGDKVTLSGKKLIPQKGMAYILLNKPKGFITTNDDPQGRRTVMDLVKSAEVGRVYPVGRLDRATTGLILITNDGDLAQRLAHPTHKIKKVYHVTLDKPLTQGDFDKIMEGLTLEDGKAEVDEMAYLEKKTEIGLEIHSGKNRIVRRIFESLGYVVEKLDRVMYAGLTKKNLPRSKWRFLDEREIVLLKHFKS
jgi:23S rRNA pseudouridine2605 synthase